VREPPDDRGRGTPNPGLTPTAATATNGTTGPAMVPNAGDPRRIGELLADWLGIQLDTVDSLTAEAAAKVEAIPDRQVLLTLLGEIIVRLGALELAVADLKGGRR
jgi:hypothetical protein